MFTGIVQKQGKIITIKKESKSWRFEVEADKFLKDVKKGDSIAVNGVCTTIVDFEKNKFAFEAIEETLKKTNFKKLKKGSLVNLEKSIKWNEKIDGHFVQGHVDETGKIIYIKNDKKRTRITISLSKEMRPFVAYKGSISINGISLTISDVEDKNFSVDIIPHTLKNTNFSQLKRNDIVNIEADMIARYLHKIITTK
ncbi:MAG: riboflavin synthase [Candidatus Peregrinibacteria bacterium]|nr:riboflavin synthase [Candidatus Peregrinibacteria bacterium]